MKNIYLQKDRTLSNPELSLTFGETKTQVYHVCIWQANSFMKQIPTIYINHSGNSILDKIDHRMIMREDTIPANILLSIKQRESAGTNFKTSLV